MQNDDIIDYPRQTREEAQLKSSEVVYNWVETFYLRYVTSLNDSLRAHNQLNKENDFLLVFDLIGINPFDQHHTIADQARLFGENFFPLDYLRIRENCYYYQDKTELFWEYFESSCNSKDVKRFIFYIAAQTMAISIELSEHSNLHSAQSQQHINNISKIVIGRIKSLKQKFQQLNRVFDVAKSQNGDKLSLSFATRMGELHLEYKDFSDNTRLYKTASAVYLKYFGQRTTPPSKPQPSFFIDPQVSPGFNQSESRHPWGKAIDKLLTFGFTPWSQVDLQVKHSLENKQLYGWRRNIDFTGSTPTDNGLDARINRFLETSESLENRYKSNYFYMAFGDTLQRTITDDAETIDLVTHLRDTYVINMGIDAFESVLYESLLDYNWNSNDRLVATQSKILKAYPLMNEKSRKEYILRIKHIPDAKIAAYQLRYGEKLLEHMYRRVAISLETKINVSASGPNAYIRRYYFNLCREFEYLFSGTGNIESYRTREQQSLKVKKGGMNAIGQFTRDKNNSPIGLYTKNGEYRALLFANALLRTSGLWPKDFSKITKEQHRNLVDFWHSTVAPLNQLLFTSVANRKKHLLGIAPSYLLYLSQELRNHHQQILNAFSHTTKVITPNAAVNLPAIGETGKMFKTLSNFIDL